MRCTTALTAAAAATFAAPAALTAAAATLAATAALGQSAEERVSKAGREGWQKREREGISAQRGSAQRGSGAVSVVAREAA